MLKVLNNFTEDTLTTLGTNNSSQIATGVLAGFKMFFIPLATSKDKKATHEQKTYTIARDVITEGLALTTYLGVTALVQKFTTSPICKMYYKNKANKIETGKLKSAEQLTKEELDFLKNVDTKKLDEIGMSFITEKKSKPRIASAEAIEYSKQFDSIVSKINGKSVKTNSVDLKDFVADLSKNGIQKGKKGISVLVNDFKNAAKGSVEIMDAKNLFKNTRISMSQVSVWVLALAVIPPLCNLIITPVMKKWKEWKDKKNPVAKNGIDINTMQKNETSTTLTSVTKPDLQKSKDIKFERNYYNMSNLGNMRVG